MQKDIDFYYKKGRLSQLRGFCSIVQNECSIAKAFKKTGIESATLSKQIRTLENDLGIQLFDRSGYNKLKMTTEGELFYKEAIRHLNGIDSMFENFRKDVKEFRDNHLNIAIHHTAAAYIFPSIFKKMLSLAEFENLTVNICVIQREEGLKKLINKEVDLVFYAFVPTDKLLDGLEKIKSIPDNVLLVFNKSHELAKKQTVTIEDMSKYKFLNRNIKTKTYGNIFTYPSSIFIDGNSFEIALEIVKQTDNMTTLPELFFRSSNLNNSEVESRNINHLLGTAYFYTILRENETQSKPIAWLINELKSLIL